jgi:hypothetical protein
MIAIELIGPCGKVREDEAAIWYEGTAPTIGTTYRIEGEVKPPLVLVDCYIYKWDYVASEWKHEKTIADVGITSYDVSYDIYSYYTSAYGVEGWWAIISVKRIRGEKSKWAMLHVMKG